MDIQRKDEIALSSLVTNESIRAAMPEWDTFSEEDRRFLREEMLKVMDERVRLGMSVLAVGESLKKIREKLAPMRLFSKFCENLNYTRSTANKYISSFERAQKALPEPGLRVAMAMGLKIISEDDSMPLGVYTHAVKGLMMPKGSDTRQWRAYWEDAEKKRRRLAATAIERRQSVDVDVDAIAKSIYRFDLRRLRKVSRAKSRMAILERVFGIHLTEHGISRLTVAAEAVPGDFVPVVGRPAKKEEE